MIIGIYQHLTAFPARRFIKYGWVSAFQGNLLQQIPGLALIVFELPRAESIR